jgi:hypothetical protein
MDTGEAAVLWSIAGRREVYSAVDARLIAWPRRE